VTRSWLAAQRGMKTRQSSVMLLSAGGVKKTGFRLVF
jgi:hypothetical protein